MKQTNIRFGWSIRIGVIGHRDDLKLTSRAVAVVDTCCGGRQLYDS